LDLPAYAVTMTDFDVRALPLADTRALRQQVLRPHQTVEELADHEPAGAVAFGAFQDPSWSRSGWSDPMATLTTGGCVGWPPPRKPAAGAPAARS
jgi:hypothetical protein